MKTNSTTLWVSLVREKKHLIEQSYNIKSFKQWEDNEMFLYLFLFHQREMKLI